MCSMVGKNNNQWLRIAKTKQEHDNTIKMFLCVLVIYLLEYVYAFYIYMLNHTLASLKTRFASIYMVPIAHK